jgi:hypothetical protein
VAKGSPISSTIAEIFIQHLEDSFIKPLLDSKSITFYARYVDDIYIIYDSSHTNPNAITQLANTVHNNVQIILLTEGHTEIEHVLRPAIF